MSVMKYTFICALIFSLLTSFAFAQEQAKPLSSLPQKKEEIKLHIDGKKEELKIQIEEKRVEIKNQFDLQKNGTTTRLQFFAQERVTKIVSLIFQQFEAVLVKFDGITLRLQARIQKLNDQGISTTVSETLLLNAQSKIQESTTLIVATKLELESAIAGEISKEQIKNSIDACKTSLKETQEALIDVINSLKQLDGSEEDLFAE